MRELGYSVVIDMRGNSSWSTVKPILKVLQDYFSNNVHTAHIIKPDNFWQKQRTNLGSQKYKFEVRTDFNYKLSISTSISTNNNFLALLLSNTISNLTSETSKSNNKYNSD